ncbi:efflux MFS transporter permease [Jatrophihabitans fulvus]
MSQVASSPSTEDPEAAELNPRRWFLLGVCVSALFMTLLDATVVTVALPTIGRSLEANPAELQWVVSGYILAFSLVPIVAGRLGDDRGRRRMLLVGIAGFVLTSLLAGLAPTPGVLLAARLLQGLAGGLVNPQVSGLVQQLFPLSERGRAFGVLGLNVGLAQALGPVLGGLIIAVGGVEFGWRLTFLVNVPVGTVAFLLVWRMLPRDRVSATPRALDLPGVALLTVGLAGVLYPVVQYDADRDATRLLFVLPALAVLVGFLRWERGPARRRGHPLIDTSLFSVRSFSDGLGLALLYFAGAVGTTLLLSLFLQNGLGFSALQSGLTATGFAAGLAIAAPIAGRMVAAHGRMVLVVGLALFVTGITGAATTAQLAAGHLPPSHLLPAMLPWLFLAGLGGGCVVTPNQSLSLAEVDVSGGSTAGGMLQTAQRMGGAVGGAVLSAVFYGRLAGETGGASALERGGHYGHAYAVAMYVVAGLALAALTLAIVEVRRSRRTATA